MRTRHILGAQKIAMTFDGGSIFLAACGFGCFIIRIADKERREAINEYARGWDKLSYLLIAVTAFLCVIKATFNAIDIDEALGAVPLWSILQVGLCSFAAGIVRANRRW